jgi:hypothetical protein
LRIDGDVYIDEAWMGLLLKTDYLVGHWVWRPCPRSERWVRGGGMGLSFRTGEGVGGA